MGFKTWLFGKQGNALTVLSDSNAELRRLLFLSQKHSADLLIQLSTIQKAMLNGQGNGCQTDAMEARPPTPKEQEVLDLLKSSQSITTKDITEALGHKCRQVSSAMVFKMVKKGFLKRVGNGKLCRYVLF